MGIATGCTVEDVAGLLRDIADELALSTFPDHRLQRMAKVWHWSLRDRPYPHVRDAVKRLMQRWEKPGMPRVQDLLRALQAPRSTTAGERDLLAWVANAMDGPCPICGREATWEPRFMADCDPRRHFDAGTPLVGCHPYLHALARDAQAQREPWPDHPQPYGYAVGEAEVGEEVGTR